MIKSQPSAPSAVPSPSTPEPAAVSTYVSTYLGHRFYPLEPRIDVVALEDIAQGLAYQCRFNGQTRAFYSVAQHSLMVAELVPRRLRLPALLHDAAEAYVGDMVKPLKILLPDFARIEDAVLAIIGRRFGVDLTPHPAIKRADLIALATEKRDLMPHSTERWDCLHGVAPQPRRIEPMPAAVAKAAFLAACDAELGLLAA